jgi:hypothetical protein
MISARMDLLSPAMEKLIVQHETAAMRAMRWGAEGAQGDLRETTISAGLGSRVSNAWRMKVYPEQGRSLNPAAYIWSKAPRIIDAFDRGATIRPVNGAAYLWLPTKNVPRRRARRDRQGQRIRAGAMTPDEVDSFFNSEFVFKPGKNGTLLAYVNAVSSRNGKSFRPATAGRLSGRHGMAPRKSELVLMFVLRRWVKMPKSIDIASVANRWGPRTADRLTADLNQ